MLIRRKILDDIVSTVRSMLTGVVPERVLFLTGEAGIGKSTLIQQLVEDLLQEPQTPIIALAECSTPVAGSGVGYVESLKPFADIMARLVEAGSQTQKSKKLGGFKLDIGKFLVDTAPSWIGLIPLVGAPIFHALSIVGSGYDQVYLHKKLKSDGSNAATNQEQVFRQYINFLSKLAEQSPVVIIIDDFHWADASSTNLLFAAARELVSSPIVFVISYREYDVLGSAKHEEHPIAHIRNEIERYSLSQILDVPRADERDIELLIHNRYPEYISNDVLEQWLLKITDGNLLFATHYLATLEHEGYIHPQTALLVKDVDTMPVPSSANAVVEEYIRRLSRDDKEQLRYASVEGETISANMAARLLDQPIIKVIQRLRGLVEEHHIIRALGTQTLYANESSSYQFVHYLVHKTLYDDLAKEERTMLHATAVDVLLEELTEAEAAEHNVHIVAARLAAHAIVAGRHIDAAQALLKGARWVWRSFSADEALRLIEDCQVVVNAETERSQHSQKQPLAELLSISLDALLLKADILRHRGQFAVAAQCYESAITLANAHGSTAQKCTAYIGFAVITAFLGKQEEAERIARHALLLAEDGGTEASRIHAMRVIGVTYAQRSMFDKAMEYDTKCLMASIALGDEVGRAGALTNLGCVLDYTGHPVQGLEHHREALEINRRVNRPEGMISGLLNVGGSLNTLGDNDGAMQHFEEAVLLARSIGALREEAKVLNNMGIVRRQQGDFNEALVLVEQSLAIMERIGDREAVMHALPAIGDIYRDTGRIEPAIKLYERSGDVAREIGNPSAVAKATLFVAFALLLDNRPAEALPLFIETREQFASIGAADREIEAALGIVTCQVKIEAAALSATPASRAAVVTSEQMLAKTRAAMPERDLDLERYERIWRGWISDLDRLGVILKD